MLVATSTVSVFFVFVSFSPYFGTDAWPLFQEELLPAATVPVTAEASINAPLDLATALVSPGLPSSSPVTSLSVLPVLQIDSIVDKVADAVQELSGGGASPSSLLESVTESNGSTVDFSESTGPASTSTVDTQTDILTVPASAPSSKTEPEPEPETPTTNRSTETQDLASSHPIDAQILTVPVWTPSDTTVSSDKQTSSSHHSSSIFNSSDSSGAAWPSSTTIAVVQISSTKPRRPRSTSSSKTTGPSSSKVASPTKITSVSSPTSVSVEMPTSSSAEAVVTELPTVMSTQLAATAQLIWSETSLSSSFDAVAVPGWTLSSALSPTPLNTAGRAAEESSLPQRVPSFTISSDPIAPVEPQPTRLWAQASQASETVLVGPTLENSASSSEPRVTSDSMSMGSTLRSSWELQSKTVDDVYSSWEETNTHSPSVISIDTLSTSVVWETESSRISTFVESSSTETLSVAASTTYSGETPSTNLETSKETWTSDAVSEQRESPVSALPVSESFSKAHTATGTEDAIRAATGDIVSSVSTTAPPATENFTVPVVIESANSTRASHELSSPGITATEGTLDAAARVGEAPRIDSGEQSSTSIGTLTGELSSQSKSESTPEHTPSLGLESPGGEEPHQTVATATSGWGETTDPPSMSLEPTSAPPPPSASNTASDALSTAADAPSTNANNPDLSTTTTEAPTPSPETPTDSATPASETNNDSAPPDSGGGSSSKSPSPTPPNDPPTLNTMFRSLYRRASHLLRRGVETAGACAQCGWGSTIYAHSYYPTIYSTPYAQFLGTWTEFWGWSQVQPETDGELISYWKADTATAWYWRSNSAQIDEQAIWYTGLKMHDDGVLRMWARYETGWVAVWESTPPSAAGSGEAGGNFCAVLQPDANFVVYSPSCEVYFAFW